MLRDNLVGLIGPMFSRAGAYPLALCTARQKPSDDRPPCLENPRPGGAESTLTENAASPFHAEPTHQSLSSNLLFQVLAGKILHGDEGSSFMLVDLVDHTDVGVIQSGSGPGFPAETFQSATVVRRIVGDLPTSRATAHFYTRNELESHKTA